VLGVGVVAGCIVAYKQTRGPATTPSSPPHATADTSPQVLVFVDPREADEVGGCGDIIRLARAARSHGIGIRELPPGSETAPRG
jgi:hypothetical protein